MTRSLRAVLLAVLLAGTTASVSARQAELEIAEWLDRYLAGQFDAAVRLAAATPDVEVLRRRLPDAARDWMAREPAQSKERRAAVAGFILELTHARLETDWGRLRDLVEWACDQLRRPGPSDRFERAWDEASIALASRARDRQWLLAFPTLPERQGVRAPRGLLGASPGHLIHVRQRFPDDASFRLAHVVAWTWAHDAEPTRNELPRLRIASAPPQQLAALDTLEALTHDPSVAAEALIVAGRLLFSSRRYQDAWRSFDAAAPVARDHTTRYSAHFWAGRTLETLGRPKEAARAYLEALAALPSGESATLALASLDFADNRYSDAISRVNERFGHAEESIDPARLTGYGSFIRWPALKAAMRAEVHR